MGFQEFFKDGTLLHILAHISRKTDQIFMKISSEMYLWTSKPHSFLEVIRSRTPGSLNSRSGLQIQTKSALAEVCASALVSGITRVFCNCVCIVLLQLTNTRAQLRCWIIVTYILSRTVSNLSHSISEICAFEWGVPLFNALFLSNLWENCHESCLARNSMLQTVWIWL